MIVLLLILIGFLLVLATMKITAYTQAVKYIKMEIARSDTRKEYNHWVRELKTVRLSFFTGMSMEKARKIVKKNTKR